jgi:integrase
MSSVRKRILPSGEIRWQVDYKDQQGKRRSRQFKTKQQAVDYETTVRGEMRTGVHVADAASVTVEKAGELWLDQCRNEELEIGTIRNYRAHLDLHILPRLGGVKLSRLTRPMVETFKDQLIKKHSKKLAAKVLVSLKAMMGDAMRRGLVGQNAATGVRVKLGGRDDQRARIPSKDEIRALIGATGAIWDERSPWRAFMIAAIFTGMRPSELRGLVWGAIDFDQRIIKVRQRADYRNQMGSPKSKAGTRDVPLASIALNALKQWRLACPRKTDLDLVFPRKDGGVIMITEPHRKWNDLLEAAGLPRLSYRYYDTRHIAASLLIEAGWQPKKIQTVMGHANIQTTFNTYGHLWTTPESDQEALDQVEARLLQK